MKRFILFHGKRYPRDMGAQEVQQFLSHLAEAPARGHAMAALLEKLAERHMFSTIPDPVKRQRELRQDRVLPGREG